MYRTGDLVRWRAGRRPSSTSGAATSRSRSADSASNSARSTPCSTAHPTSGSPPRVGRAGPAGDTAARLVRAARPSGADVDAGGTAHRRVGAHCPRTWCPPRWSSSNEIPLTPVGKLDRAALPAPEFVSPAPAFRAAGDRLEAAVVDAFAEVLGRGPGRGRRQLLRSRRQLAARDQVDRRPAGPAGPEGPAAMDVPRPDPGGPRPPDRDAAGRARCGRGARRGDSAARGTGTGRPLFCVHPGNRAVVGVRRSGAVSPAGPAGRSDCSCRRSAADRELPSRSSNWPHRYVEEMRAIQPDGPVRPARLVARRGHRPRDGRRTAAAGEEVATLAVMDSYPDDGEDPLLGRLDMGDLLRGLGLAVTDGDGEMTTSAPRELLERIVRDRDCGATRRTPRTDRRRIREFAAAGPPIRAAGVRRGPADLPRDRATRRHDARPVGGRVAAARDRRIEEHPVDCGHNDMIEPQSLAVIGPVLSGYPGRSHPAPRRPNPLNGAVPLCNDGVCAPCGRRTSFLGDGEKLPPPAFASQDTDAVTL